MLGWKIKGCVGAYICVCSPVYLCDRHTSCVAALYICVIDAQPLLQPHTGCVAALRIRVCWGESHNLQKLELLLQGGVVICEVRPMLVMSRVGPKVTKAPAAATIATAATWPA